MNDDYERLQLQTKKKYVLDDLHATLKMEGGKMRLELVVECAYDDGNKQASMNLTTPPDQHDNIYTDARHYGDDEFDAVYDEDEEENLPF